MKINGGLFIGVCVGPIWRVGAVLVIGPMSYVIGVSCANKDGRNSYLRYIHDSHTYYRYYPITTHNIIWGEKRVMSYDRLLHHDV